MEISQIKKVLIEVNRFQEKAREAISRLECDDWAKYGCAEIGSLKRSSLDLTRALSKMRNPQ